jgi:hypothetical protein
MADEQRGLLDGLDPEILKQLRAAAATFGPSDEEQHKAKMQGILATGLGILAHSYQPLSMALGQGGLLGVKARDDALQQFGQQRSQGMQGVGSMLGLQQMMDQRKQAMEEQNAAKEWAANQGQPPVGMGPPSPSGQMSLQPSPSGIAPPAPTKQTKFEQYEQMGNFYQSKGLVAAAQKAFDLAEKARPKLKDTKTLTQNGQRVTVNFYDDGSTQVVPFSPDAEKLHFGDSGDRTGIGFDQFSGEQKTAGLVKKATPGEVLTNARARDALAAQDNEPMSRDAIDNAAARYNIDGTLPAMGMGKNARVDRRDVLNRAAELAKDSGLSGDDQRVLQIGNKANTASLAKLGQQATMVGAFEKTFNKNADLVLEYSNKVDRTGAPIANKWINAGKRAVTGDPELSAFDVAVKSASNEYAKIISGSMGNTVMAEGEIKKVEGMLNAAQTPEQVKEVIAFMKRETQNRMAGFKEQDKELRDRMRGKSTSSDPTPTTARPYGQDASTAAQSAGVPQSRYKGGVVVQLPDGKYKDFINQKYADQFKAAAGLQ